VHWFHKNASLFRLQINQITCRRLHNSAQNTCQWPQNKAKTAWREIILIIIITAERATWHIQKMATGHTHTVDYKQPKTTKNNQQRRNNEYGRHKQRQRIWMSFRGLFMRLLVGRLFHFHFHMTIYIYLLFILSSRTRTHNSGHNLACCGCQRCVCAILFADYLLIYISSKCICGSVCVCLCVFINFLFEHCSP